MKKCILAFALSLFAVGGYAQKYVVLSITGKVLVEDKGAQKELQLRQTLLPTAVVQIPYKGQVELLDSEAKKKHVLKVPGQGPLGELLKDRQNNVMQLTEQYLAYLKTRVNGKGELTSKRFSDPATVTREVVVKEQDAKEEFYAFRQKAHAEYEKFRQKAISEYAAFMRKAWQEFKAQPAVTPPADERVEPVVAPPDDGQQKELSDVPIQLAGVPLLLPKPAPQPAPASPIMEQPVEEGEYVEFTLYGTQLRVRFTGKELFVLNSLDEQSVADVFERLQSADFNNTIRDCLELRIRHQFCDWAYLKMLDAFSKACFQTPDEATLLMAFVYQQSGYKMRLGVSGGHLVMLYASEHCIFGHTYFEIDHENFYPYGGNISKMNICEAAYPQERPLSLLIPQLQMLSDDRTDERVLSSTYYTDITAAVSVNRNLLDFYNEYPPSKIHDNLMTRWAMIANAPMDPTTAASLKAAFQDKLSGLSEKEAVERLLNWVQTAFEYKYDKEIWGCDRAFFADETLSYPYCDCEDRSILFSRMVRDLLDLPAILICYPDHLAMGVGFNEDVRGDYITVKGKRFVVCDPTYINAHVGETMPTKDNKTAQVILLQ